MSATADLPQGELVSSSLLSRHSIALSRTRQTPNTAKSASSTSVDHSDRTAQQLAEEAALGHALMHVDNPNLLSELQQQQSVAMQQAVAQLGKLPVLIEQMALTRVAEQAMLQLLADRTQKEKFRSERAKRDARFPTDEQGGRAPGKSIEAPDTGGAAL